MLETPLKIEVLSRQKSSIHGDNQQVKSMFLSKREKLQYLAGIWDGEGSFMIAKVPNHEGRIYRPISSLTNTGEKLIVKVCEILRDLGINPYIIKRKMGKRWKDAYMVQIMFFSKNKKFLSLIIPFLIEKKERAKILLQFVESRLDKLEKKIGAKNKPYTEEEMALREMLMKLNKRGKDESSETICLAPKGEMI